MADSTSTLKFQILKDDHGTLQYLKDLKKATASIESAYTKLKKAMATPVASNSKAIQKTTREYEKLNATIKKSSLEKIAPKAMTTNMQRFNKILRETTQEVENATKGQKQLAKVKEAEAKINEITRKSLAGYSGVVNLTTKHIEKATTSQEKYRLGKIRTTAEENKATVVVKKNTALRKLASIEQSNATKAMKPLIQNLATYKSQLTDIQQNVKGFASGTGRMSAVTKAQTEVVKKASETHAWYVQELEKVDNALDNVTDEQSLANLVTKEQKLLTEQASVSLKQNVAIHALYNQEAKSKTTIDKQASGALRNYTEFIKVNTQNIRLQKGAAAKAIAIEQASMKIREGAINTEKQYDREIGITTKAIKNNTDAVRKRTYEYKLQQQEQNRALVTETQTRALANVNTMGVSSKGVNVAGTMASVTAYSRGIEQLVATEKARKAVILESTQANKEYEATIGRLKLAVDNSSTATERAIYEEKVLQIQKLQSANASKTLMIQTKLDNLEKVNSKVVTADVTASLVLYKKTLSELSREFTSNQKKQANLLAYRKLAKQVTGQATTNTKSYTDAIKTLKASLDGETDATKKQTMQLRLQAYETAVVNVETEKQIMLGRIHKNVVTAWATKMNTFANSVLRVGRFMSRYLTTSILAATAAGVKMSASIEAQIVRFGILTQSMAKGERLYRQLVEYSARTPFQLSEIDDAAQILLAFGTDLNDVNDQLRRLGDVAQGDSDKLERVAMSFGKVESRGTAHMRELNRFIMSGVPIIDELNKQFGTTGDELFKMVEGNKVTFANIKLALESLTNEGGKFYQMTEKISETLEGRYSTALDNMKLNLASVTDAYTDSLKKILEKFIAWSQGFRALDAESKKLLTTTLAFTAAMGPMAIAIAKTIQVVKAAVAGFTWWKLALTALGATIAAINFFRLKKQMNNASDTAAKLTEYTKDLTAAQNLQDAGIASLTLANYSLAKSQGAYTSAIELTIEKEQLLADLDSKYKKTAEMKEFKKYLEEITALYNIQANFSGDDSFDSEAFTDSFIEGILGTPDKDKLRELVSEATGVDFVEDITRENLENIDLASLATVFDTSLDDFWDKTEASWRTSAQERINAIDSGEALRAVLGMDEESLQTAFDNLASNTAEGIQSTEDALDTYTISLSSALDRTRTSINQIKSARDDLLASMENQVSITSGDMSMYKNMDRTKAEASKAIDKYIETMQWLVDARISEIKGESIKENAILALMGMDNAKATKESINTQLDDVQAAFTEFLVDGTYTVQDFMDFESGAKVTPELIASLTEYSDLLTAELKRLTKQEARVDLFEAFFGDDLDSANLAKVQAEIDTALEDLASNTQAYEVDALFGFLEAGTLADHLDTEGKKLVGGLESLYAEMVRLTTEQADNSNMITAFLGAPEDWSTYLQEMHLSELTSELNDLLIKEAQDTGMSVLQLLNMGEAYSGTQLASLMAEVKQLLAVVDEVTEAELADHSSFIEAYVGTPADFKEYLDSLRIATLVEQLNTKIRTAVAQNPGIPLDIILEREESMNTEAGSMLKELRTYFIEEAEKQESTDLFDAFFGGADTLAEYKEGLAKELDFTSLQEKIGQQLTDGMTMVEYLEAGVYTEDIAKLVAKIEGYFVTEAEADDNSDMIEALIGGKADWDEYINSLKIETLTARLGNILQGVSLEEVFSEGFDESKLTNTAQGIVTAIRNLMKDEDTLLEQLFGIDQEEDSALYDFIDGLANVLQSELIPAFEDLGEAIASGDSAAESLSSSISGIASAIVSAMPQLLFEAGVELLKDSDSRGLGIALIGASGLTSLLNGILGGTSSASTTSSSSISYSAKGDVFNDGYIANSPTLRSTAYGASMIGEAGSEAVLPLTRINGTLGVASTGSSGVQVNIINNSGAEITETETTSADGSKSIEIVVNKIVKSSMAKGDYDNTLGTNFGLRRQGRR